MTWKFFFGFSSCFGLSKKSNSSPESSPVPCLTEMNEPSNVLKYEPCHLISSQPASSLYVFPPTPRSTFQVSLLEPPQPTKALNRFTSSKSKLTSWNDSSYPNLKMGCKKDFSTKVPRLHLGISSSIFPQTSLNPRQNLLPSFISVPSPCISTFDKQDQEMNELVKPLSLIRDPSHLIPSSIRRLKAESTMSSMSMIPPCLAFVSFHSPIPSASFPSFLSLNSSSPTSTLSPSRTLSTKRLKWKPYYLSFYPHSETPILCCHRDSSLSDSSVSIWVQLPIDVQCEWNTSMNLNTLDLIGKFPFLVQKKIKFRDSFFSLNHKKRKRDTWTRTYAGLSLHFVDSHNAKVWREYLQQMSLDTSLQVLARVMMQPSPSSFSEPEQKNVNNTKELESELALLHLELKKVQGLQNRT